MIIPWFHSDADGLYNNSCHWKLWFLMIIMNEWTTQNYYQVCTIITPVWDNQLVEMIN